MRVLLFFLLAGIILNGFLSSCGVTAFTPSTYIEYLNPKENCKVTVISSRGKSQEIIPEKDVLEEISNDMKFCIIRQEMEGHHTNAQLLLKSRRNNDIFWKGPLVAGSLAGLIFIPIQAISFPLFVVGLEAYTLGMTIYS
ncbi:MAG: hypothetical protein K9I34_07360, partial [Bacteroidales bacterium]|nr:hypothetical protein [Bacteroidales bacterium]